MPLPTGFTQSMQLTLPNVIIPRCRRRPAACSRLLQLYSSKHAPSAFVIEALNDDPYSGEGGLFLLQQLASESIESPANLQ